ncbi:MAG: PAS domain-containing protein, partial [Crocosphaera sp.]|nr:PAS domain-containing protein [Crocosphaera sp.]
MSNVSEVRYLLVIADQKSRRIVPLTDNTYSIGRDPHSNILLYDRQVSRHHATLLKINDIKHDQPCYRIIDGNLKGKKSTNGIAVNGKYCLSHDLAPGDLIRFGNQSQANYHIIADSCELALLKESDSNPQDVETCLPLDDLPSENHVASLDEIFLEDEEEDDQPKTMTFGNREKNKDSEPFKNQASLADSNPNPIIELDFQGQITYLNAAAKIKFPDLIKLQALHPILQNLIGKRTPKEGTSFVREIQFEQSFFEQHIHYLKESECLRSYLFEITKYRKREVKLTAGKDRYRFFFEQSTEGILVINPDTKHIIEANQAYCQLLGYSSAEIIGCNLYQLLETER